MSAQRQRKVVLIKDGKKVAALELLRERFDLPTLVSVIQRGSSDSTYELKLEGGRIIVLGIALEIHQQAKVRARLFDANAMMPKHSAEKWDEVLHAIRDAVEEVETLTEAEELRDYVLDFLGKSRSRLDGREDIRGVDFSDEDKIYLLRVLNDRSHKGFYDRHSGIAYLPLGKFVEHLNFHSGRRWRRREVADLLSRHGFEFKQKSVRYTDESGASKTYNVGRFWTSPEAYVPTGTAECS